MIEYETRALSIIVLPKDAKVFDERCTTITVEDESGGEFVIVSQRGNVDRGDIAINPEEWPMLRSAIDRMISECREES